jgi:hypothetical protein
MTTEPIVVLMDRGYSKADLQSRLALDLRNIKGSVWDDMVSTCRAVDLRLYHLMVRSLDGIERLDGTTILSAEWANNVSDLTPIFRMSWLQKLFLSDFPQVRGIEGIGALTALTELHLSGNRGSLYPPLRISSIRPIAALSKLRKLTLANIRLADSDISCIASLPALKDLDLPYRFDRKQFAFLAKRLNPQLTVRIRASDGLNVGCRTCGANLFVFRGKRVSVICRACEAGKFETLTVQFENLVDAS